MKGSVIAAAFLFVGSRGESSRGTQWNEFGMNWLRSEDERGVSEDLPILGDAFA